MKSVTVRAIIDPKKKGRVTKILGKLGINHSEAINIYYSLIEEYKGLPFNIKLPETLVNENINLEVIDYLKESVKNNHRLGELLGK